MTTALVVRENRFQRFRRQVREHVSQAAGRVARQAELTMGSYLSVCGATAHVINRAPVWGTNPTAAPRTRELRQKIRPMRYGGRNLMVPPLI